MSRFDICISQATYFDAYERVPAGYRRMLWRNCLRSLAASDLRGLNVLLLVRDDGSAEPPTPQELLLAGATITVRCEPQPHTGFSPHLSATVRAACGYAQWVLWLDDDGLLHPRWLHEAQRLVHIYPASRAYGLFNSHYHPTVEDCGDHVLKPYLTELGMWFRSADYCRLHEHSSLLGALLCQGDQRRFPCAAPSVVQHQGRLGFNNPRGDDYDPAFNYSALTFELEVPDAL